MRKNAYITSILIILISIIFTGFKNESFSNLLNSFGSNNTYSTSVSRNSPSSGTQTISKTNNENKKIASLNYKSDSSAIIEINNNKSTLKFSNWKTNKVIYGKLDGLNRTSNGTTAYLEPRNVTNDSLRTTQYVKPTGWHQKYYNGEAILNRGHLIAYSLSKGIDKNGHYDTSQESGDQNNLKNLFTQTAFSNQKLQTIYEYKVRNSLNANHRVIYQVTPVFRRNELMARGVHIQAISDDNSLDFNVYIYNVEPNYTFNYTDGTSYINTQMKVPEPTNTPSF